MKLHLLHRSLRPRQLGFGLIELMVGLVISLLAIVIMMRMLTTAESARRTTTSGDDALMNATVAMHELQTELRSAGYGISSYSILGCTLTYTTTSDTTSVTVTLAPAMINPAASPNLPAGDTNTDTLFVFGTNGNSPSEGDPTVAVSTSSGYTVSTPYAYATGDYIVVQTAARPSTCALTLDKITAVNTSTGVITTSGATSGMAVGSLVFDLGQAPALHAYAVRNGNLTMCDFMAYNCASTSYTSTLSSTVWVPVASNIPSLRAQYGRDTTNVGTSAMDGTVDTFDQTTPGSSSDTSGLSSYCSWARVLNTRIALVGRGEQYDKSMPTSAAPTWIGSTVNTSTAPTNPTALALTLSGFTNWQYYRYRLVTLNVAMRSSIWAGSQSTNLGGSGGC